MPYLTPGQKVRRNSDFDGYPFNWSHGDRTLTVHRVYQKPAGDLVEFKEIEGGWQADYFEPVFPMKEGDKISRKTVFCYDPFSPGEVYTVSDVEYFGGDVYVRLQELDGQWHAERFDEATGLDLLSGLRKYTCHLRTCSFRMSKDGACDCGLDDLLSVVSDVVT